MIRIAICDDIDVFTYRVKKTLQEYNFNTDLEIDVFNSGRSLFEKTIKEKYDIILIDIHLSEDEAEENGMIISNKIKNIYPDIIIIFLTGYDGYEHSLLNFEPFRFIRKPIDDKILIEDVKSAIRRINNWKNKFIVLRLNGIYIKVNLNEIMYITSQSPYIIIKTLNDEDLKIRGKIDDIQKEINKISEGFVRPNKSFLINKMYIKQITSKFFKLSNGEQVTISRKYSKVIFEVLSDF